MALNFMDLLGSMIQGGGMTPSSNQRMSNAGGGLQDLLGSLMGAGQTVKNKVGGDNLAATGIGALLGALTGKSQSTTLNSLGGGLMGLLGMMAYKAFTNKGSSNNNVNQNQPAYNPPTPQQQASDAEIILLAMIDAAKSDGQVDANELNKIMAKLQESGIGQEGVNYVINKLNSPMETTKILAATRNRPDLAAQVYAASLMAIEVDTDAERNYLDKLAKGMGLTADVIGNIEEMTGTSNTSYVC